MFSIAYDYKAEAYTMLQEAYGEFVLPYSTGRRWYKLFKEGRQSISKEGGPGAPVTALKEENSNTAAVIVREDRRITLRPHSEILKISVHHCGSSGSMCACHAAGPGSIPGRDKFPG